MHAEFGKFAKLHVDSSNHMRKESSPLSCTYDSLLVWQKEQPASFLQSMGAFALSIGEKKETEERVRWQIIGKCAKLSLNRT